MKYERRNLIVFLILLLERKSGCARNYDYETERVLIPDSPFSLTRQTGRFLPYAQAYDFF